MSAYLLLGRTGDLLSILPFLKAEADAGEKPTLIVSNQHSDLFDGVSYVNVVPFDGGIHMLREAFEWAKAKYPGVKSLQVIGGSAAVHDVTYGPAGQECARTTSFIKEQWKLAGHMAWWDDVLPLRFDQRSPEREAALLKACKVEGTPGRKKPLLLVSCQGHSSPFPYAELLLELIRGRFSKDYRVMELPRSPRIYDLLALYERAHCLVATDSAPLHLARAVPDLPVIALTNDSPILWNGSPWQPQWVWCCRYHDWPERAVGMLKAIQRCEDPKDTPFVHVWNHYDNDGMPDTLTQTFGRNHLPIFKGACGRDSENVLNDPKRIPYLKDCLRMGLQRATDTEHVCLTRPDTRFETGITAINCDTCFAYRMTGTVRSNMSFSPIGDMFMARKSWWKTHLAEIPDLLLGNDYQWSEALRVMFQKYGAKDVTGVCYREAKHA